jgi:hypothetical protein
MLGWRFALHQKQLTVSYPYTLQVTDLLQSWRAPDARCKREGNCERTAISNLPVHLHTMHKVSCRKPSTTEPGSQAGSFVCWDARQGPKVAPEAKARLKRQTAKT